MTPHFTFCVLLNLIISDYQAKLRQYLACYIPTNKLLEEIGI